MFFSLMFSKATQSINALSTFLSFFLRSADGDGFVVSAVMVRRHDAVMMMMAQDRCKGAWSAFRAPRHG